MNLVGTCSGSGLERYVEIQDFCIGGMYLSYQAVTNLPPEQVFTPQQDDIIEIRCSVPAPAANQDVIFQGRVVRSDSNSAGITFINPDLGALQLLQDYAKTLPAQQTQQRKDEGNDTSEATLEGIDTRELINACKAKAEVTLDVLMKVLIKETVDTLFNMAGENYDGNVQEFW